MTFSDLMGVLKELGTYDIVRDMFTMADTNYDDKVTEKEWIEFSRQIFDDNFY